MISPSDLDKFAWLNTEYVKGPISGIVLRFPGLGSTGMKTDPDPMVAAMRRRKLKVEYIESAKLGHGGPMTYEISRRIVDFVIEQLKT